VNRHLNVFTPYERPARHEDQLTRAALIVVRATPLARDALLARVGANPSGRLPELEVDMQTRDIRERPSVAGEESASVRQLISVFLSPDEGLDLAGADIAERAWEQRLDGVLRFGDELVVVIESKIVGEASSDQATLLLFRDVEVEKRTVVALGWHELMNDWWGLLERGLLAPAERVLMEDLIAFSEEHFAHLLPFTTLARAGEHEFRRQRRLMALLRETTAISEVERRPPFGAEVMLSEAIGTTSTQRIALERHDEGLVLTTWPGELKPQATALYSGDRARQLIELVDADPAIWRARPNPHLAYRGAINPAQRLYLTCGVGLEEYVRRWSSDDFDWVRAHAHDEIRNGLWPWLRGRGYAGPADDERLDGFLEGPGRRQAHLRPGLEVRRLWPWEDAVGLDERGALASEIRDAIAQVLDALDEPVLPTRQPFSAARKPTARA
jgi:hypothetical protein